VLNRTIHLTSIEMRYGSEGRKISWLDHPGIFTKRLRRSVGQ